MFRTISVSLMIKAFNLPLLYFVNLLLAWVFGVKLFGDISLVFVWISLFQLFSSLGVDTAILKLVSIANLDGSYNSIKLLIRKSYFIISFISVATCIIALAITKCFSEVSPLFSTHIYVIFIIAFLSSCLSLSQSILRGFGANITAQFPEQIVRPILLLISLASIFAYTNNNTDNNKNISIYFMLYALCALSLLCYYATRIFKYCNNLRHEVTNDNGANTYTYKNILLLSVPLCLSSSMYLINTQTDLLILGFLENSEKIGIYAAASQISRLLGLPLFTINFCFAANFARLYNDGKIDELQKIVSKLSRYNIAITLPMFILVLFFASEIIELYGTEFIAGVIVLQILSFSQMFNGIAGPVGHLLIMTGYHKLSALILLISTLLNIILNIIFVLRWGIYGAAMATAISTIVWNTAMVYCVRRNLSIKTYKLFDSSASI